MPTIVPLPSIQTTWWNVPVSSSITGSEPKSFWYHGLLTARSFTVTATWPSGGKSGIPIPFSRSPGSVLTCAGGRRLQHDGEDGHAERQQRRHASPELSGAR